MLPNEDRQIEISVVIPCYNSRKSIPELSERLVRVLGSMNVEYEIILVNDCSKDGTIGALINESEKNSGIKVIDLMYNVGQFMALMCGLESSRGEYVITMDDDLQHPPEEIPKLYHFLKDRPDLDAVLGEYDRKKHGILRNTGTFIIKIINEKIFNKPKGLKVTSFRCLTRILVETLVSHKTIIPVIGPLILKSTRRIENITVEHRTRKFGKTNYPFLKLIRTTFDNILNFSSLPLKYVSMFGTLVSFLSFILTLVYFIRYLLGEIRQPGWITIILLLNFYSGIIIFSIGLIGEYLIRILKESNHTPRFRIRKKYNFN